MELVSKCRNNLKLLEKTIKDIRDNCRPEISSERKELWNGFSGKLSRPAFGKLFVLIIDDLDRLVPEKAFAMIETLRFYFDIDNVLIIMGINDEILNSYVNKHYGVGRNKKGERFLEKIFHWNYELNYTDLQPLHLTRIRNKLGDSGIEKIKTIFAGLDRITHRKWIKLMNRIEQEIVLSKGTPAVQMISFKSALKELYHSFELYTRKFPHVIGDMHSIGEISQDKIEDSILKEAIDIIKRDRSYLYFPEKNFISLRENTKIREEEKEGF